MIEQLRKKGFVIGTLVLPTNLHTICARTDK